MKTKSRNQMSPRKPDKNSQGGYRQPAGFTLVELLVVTSIIAILIGILAPTVNKALVAAKVKKTESAIAMLSDACEQYKIDFEEYPDGDIVQLLTGYADDNGNDAAPGTNLSTDDGKTGFGFRTVTRGRVYGPYNGAETLSAAGTPPVFQDAFGEDINYQLINNGDSFLFTSPGPDGKSGTAEEKKDDITN